MDPKDLALALAQLLHDKQAEDIVLLDVEQLVGYTSYLVIASGRSDRQVKALADHLDRQGRVAGVRPMGREGTDRGQWALLDFGDVVVHVFRDEERNFYDLENLWSEAPRIDFVGDDSAAEAARGESPSAPA